MANSNFVVHNGLTVGPTTIDAASGNVNIPAYKQLAIGSVILRDNGDGKLHVRDITDNSDVQIVATLNATSTTQGNIQIGTNHIESTNTNGIISFRPNGTGNIWLSSNVLDIGRGGDITITTGGENTYPGGNLILNPQLGANAAYVKVASTTPSVSYNTGALVINGGVGIAKDLYVQGTVYTANLTATSYFAANVQAPLIYLETSSVYPYNYEIGFYSHFIGGPANVYAHTGLVRDDADGVWKLFSNVAEPAGSQVNWTNAIYDALQVGNLRVNAANGATAIINSGTSGVGNIGASGASFNTVYALATSANYADLAEKYLADAEYEPGTVVHFGGTEEVSQCNEDMCTAVAGVISTAPAYLMNAELEGEFTATVAFTGRVPCKVTGLVKKGDLMVSAGNGRARSEANPKVGSVIGKALANSEGDAVIEVVIGR